MHFFITIRRSVATIVDHILVLRSAYSQLSNGSMVKNGQALDGFSNRVKNAGNNINFKDIAVIMKDDRAAKIIEREPPQPLCVWLRQLYQNPYNCLLLPMILQWLCP